MKLTDYLLALLIALLLGFATLKVISVAVQNQTQETVKTVKGIKGKVRL